jgi:hypothetical protein
VLPGFLFAKVAWDPKAAWKAASDPKAASALKAASDKIISSLLEIDGVVDVLRTPDHKLITVEARILDELRLLSSTAAIKEAAKRLAEGDEVGITDPAFRGLVFKLASARPKDRWKVVLKYGCQPSTIIVSADKIKRLAA